METGKILIVLTILLPVITTLKKPGDKKGFTTKPMPKERDIDKSMDMSRRYKVKPGPMIEPVIFEPQRKIRLSRSTYKVNSYLDFKPYKETFKQFGHYMARFLKNIHEPHYVGNLYNKEAKRGTSCTNKGKMKRIILEHLPVSKLHISVEFRTSMYN